MYAAINITGLLCNEFFSSHYLFVSNLCLLKSRPSPMFAAIQLCYSSAKSAIRLFDSTDNTHSPTFSGTFPCFHVPVALSAEKRTVIPDNASNPYLPRCPQRRAPAHAPNIGALKQILRFLDQLFIRIKPICIKAVIRLH